MRKFWIVVAVVAAVLLLAGTALAQGPAVRPNTPGYADSDDDGVCDVCGSQTAPGAWGRGGMMMGGRWGGGSLIAAVAEALDMSTADVWAELEDGKTLSQVISDHGGDAEAIVNAFIDARKAVLDQLVEDGRLTQEQADLMLDHMREEVTEHLDETELGCGMMGRWNWNQGTPQSQRSFGGRRAPGGRGGMRFGTSI